MFMVLTDHWMLQLHAGINFLTALHIAWAKE